MIKLGILVQDHLPDLLKWRNDERIFKWCRQNDLINIHRHLAWFEKQAVDPSIQMYSILNESGILVGVCGLTSIDLLNQRAEFSLYIAPEWQGKGYGDEALRELFRLGFSRYPLNVIWGESFAGNPAIDMFLECGMTFEGIRREFYFKDGKRIDASLFSITRKDHECLSHS